MNKKKSLYIFITLAVFIVFILIFNLPSSKEPDTAKDNFVIKDNIVVGNQEGLISLINTSGEVFSSISLDEEDKKDYNPILSTKKKSFFKAKIEDEIIEDNTEIEISAQNNDDLVNMIPNSIKNRNINIVGEKDGYDIVSINIISGDYWLKIQRQLVHDMPEWVMLKIGREINGQNVLHPIYHGDIRLFIVDKGLFNSGVINEKKKEVIEESNPPKEAIEKKTKIKDIDKIELPKTKSSTENYIFSFTSKGLYVYDNMKSKLYEVKVNNDQLEVKLICKMEDVIISDFIFQNNIMYFTLSDNSNIFAYDGRNYAKVEINSEIEDWVVEKNIIYYATNKTLYKINIEDQEQMEVYLGDITTDIELINNNVYVANKFGSTISKSILHKFDSNLISYGWAELNYAKDTKVIYENDNEFLIKQNLNGEKDKLVYINKAFELQYEVGLDTLHNKLQVFNDQYVYGVSNGVLYIYSIQGDLLYNVRVDASDAFVF